MINTLLARSKLTQLKQLLKDEQKLLLQGPLDQLGPLVKRRDSLLETILNGGPVMRRFLAESLPEIRTQATRNAQLLQASIKGMKSARAVIEAMNDSLIGMETYTPDGHRVSTKPTSVTKGKRV